MQTPHLPTSTAAPQAEANLVPILARGILGLLRDRNVSPERICRGLGFSYHDVLDLSFRLSYRQTRSLILRAKAALEYPAVGIAVGARQTPLSWGLPGLAMLTCETFGDATSYIIEHQGDSGAVLEHQTYIRDGNFILEVLPKYFDQEIESFLIEEAFSGAVAISRSLIGSDFNPRLVEVMHPKPSYADAYSHFFKCPVRFNATANRIMCLSTWLGARLPGYDEVSCRPLRAQLDAALMRPRHRSDLVESLTSRLRATLDERQALREVAYQFNMSERTLRRRLTDVGVSYQALLDEIRFERAVDMLNRSHASISEVAQATGFADARSFRRAFKRWSGSLPSDWVSQTD
ncbi:MAG TPA: AraC family transcriptional regulator ligand-binding domain-containing protein [Paraburkholderia sp.]